MSRSLSLALPPSLSRLSLVGALVGALAWGGCTSSPAASPEESPPGNIGDGDGGPASVDAASVDATIADSNLADVPNAVLYDAPPLGDFCNLPGSIVFDAKGSYTVPGGPSAPDLSWVTLPAGYCLHHYANVTCARQIRVAPGGELFVASPSESTAGSAPRGLGAIVVAPDDNRDGYADSTEPFIGNLPETQGILFHDGYLYFQDHATVRRLAYKPGDRVPTGPSELQITIVADDNFSSGVHWPKTIDADDDGNIFVTNGGDQTETCDARFPRPFHGGVLRIDGTANGHRVAQGLRNPIALRCARGTRTCFGLELARDFSESQGSREKLFPVREGDDWGHPCCGTTDLPFADLTPVPNCTSVASEQDSFVIGNTPFGLDFEQGAWTGIWNHRAFVALHGRVGSWMGARVVGIATDPRTLWPVTSRERTGVTDPNALDFATGWDDGHQDHGRPAAITFSPDGRMFVANDITGEIIWIAPVIPPIHDP